MAKFMSEGRLEGITNGPNRMPMSKTQERTRNSRKKMRVFVSIDVRDVDTSTLELLNLRQRLALNVVFADGSTDQGLDKIDKGWPEGLAIWASLIDFVQALIRG